MDFQNLKKLDQTYIANTYARVDLLAGSGSGATLQGAENKKYIDFSSGIGVNALGFCAPGWAEAVKHQVDTLAHASNLYYTEPQILLAEALCNRTGMRRVFFGNSGAEANEGAIKTARKYGSDHKGPECCEIITLENSFHGRTIAALAATGQEVFHKNFGPFPQGFVYAKPNDLADLAAKVTPNTCAIMLECIQGEGGVMPLDADFVQGVTDICAQKDILLVVDEVQTGVGRTGKFLCCEHFGIKPDIVTLAKGLGGGLPIGAVLFGEKTKDTLGVGDHGATFGGNPIACAGALAVLKTIDESFLRKVTESGAYFTKRLLDMPGVAAVSGKGLMLGISLQEGLASGDVVKTCAEDGLIVLTAKAKVRLLPPLNISRQDIDAGLDILERTMIKLMNEGNPEK